MNRKEDSNSRITTPGTGASSRRLLGAPPTMRTGIAKDLNRCDRKRSLNSHDTEESADDDEEVKTAEEDDEEEETKPIEEPTSSKPEKKRRKRRRIRLTDQGLKAKRKAERRERLLAERKDREGELGENENDDEETVDEIQKLNVKEEKEADKPMPKSRPAPETLTAFQLFCENILRKLVLKDPDGYFTQPVTDEDAPDYKEVIENPMDFSTVRDKIEQNLYEKLDDFHSDIELITNNAQIYNSPGSLFFLAAQKLAILSRYYFSEKYLKYLVYSLPFGREVPADKLGLNLQTRINKEKSRQELQKEREREKIRSMIKDTANANEIIQASPKLIKNRLTSRRPNCHIAYLDNRNGAIALNVLTPTMGEESKLKLGDYLKPLEKGTPGICTPFEPIITQDYPITYTNPGPFASFAPQFDSTWATISKRESDLLFSCYGDKDNVSNAFSLRQMVATAGEAATSYVEQMLNEITEGEHSKTIDNLEGKPTAEKEQDSSTMNGRLNKTGKMLSDLVTMQNERLSRPPPTTLVNSLQPNGDEQLLADGIVQELSKNIIEMRARPQDIVSTGAVHQALGLDADDFEILSEFLEV